MALVSIKCQNCNNVYQVEKKNYVGFSSYCSCPNCRSKNTLTKKIKAECDETINLGEVPGLYKNIKDGFIYLNAGNYEDAMHAFEKDSKSVFYDLNYIYSNIGMLMLTGDSIYYNNIIRDHSTQISEEEKSVITDRTAQIVLNIYCKFEDLKRIQYIIDNYYHVLEYDFLNVFESHNCEPFSAKRKIAFELKKLSHSQIANIVISLLQNQQNSGIEIDFNQFDIILNCANIEYLAPLLSFLMKSISVNDLFHIMINHALSFKTTKALVVNDLFLNQFPPQLLEFFLKNGLSISEPVELMGYTEDYEGYTAKECHLSISDIFSLPFDNIKHFEIEMHKLISKFIPRVSKYNPKIMISYISSYNLEFSALMNKYKDIIERYQMR